MGERGMRTAAKSDGVLVKKRNQVGVDEAMRPLVSVARSRR